MPSLTENLFFQYELNISQKSFNSLHTSYSSGFEQKYDVQIRYFSVSNNIFVRYRIKIQNFTPAIQAGMFFNKNFYDYYTKITRYDSRGDVMASQEDIENPFKNDHGFIIGINYPFSIKKLNGNINLNYKNGYKAYFFTTTNILQVNIAINLKKIR
jgi:hypothetical protein